tara:strand:+ start:571 stop:789 length:219 start_codon:yes stop_codon:yes gene_type:complete
MSKEINYLLVTIHGDHTEKERLVDWHIEGEERGTIPDDCATRSFGSIRELYGAVPELSRLERSYVEGGKRYD